MNNEEVANDEVNVDNVEVNVDNVEADRLANVMNAANNVIDEVKERMKPCADFINANLHDFVLLHRIKHSSLEGPLYEVSLTMDKKMPRGSKYTCMHYTNLSDEEINEPVNRSFEESYKSVECDCTRNFDVDIDTIEISKNNANRMTLMIYNITDIAEDFLNML